MYWANRSFNCPALMKPETHFDLVARQSFIKSLVVAVFKDVRELVYLCDHFNEREQGKVCHLLIWSRDLPGRLVFKCDKEIILVFELPNKKESVTNVLVCRPSKLINYWVSDISDLVDKHHHWCLQYLCRVCKVPDVAESKDSKYSLPSNHGIYVTLVSNICTQNLSSSLTKAKSQQVSNLNDSIFKNLCLILHILLLLFDTSARILILFLKHWQHSCLLDLIWSGSKWVFGNKLHNFEHALNRIKYQCVSVISEHDAGYGQHYANERSTYNGEDGC